MANIRYKGDVVNSVLEQMNGLTKTIPSLSTSLRNATNYIISSRGFNQYIGGISSDTFSSSVEKCGEIINQFIREIKQKQITVLAYSKDKAAINTFLDNLSRKEFDTLDLGEIKEYIGLDRKAGNLFKGVGATAATAGIGLAEGVADFIETGADLVTLGTTLFKSIFTEEYDLLTGNNITDKMWEETKAKISEKKAESIFNRFYDNSELGQYIKENAKGFETVRGIGKGLGYTVGVIGLTALTGGLGAGSISPGALALTGGTFGFSNGTEEAWADGAGIGKGLMYGAASGTWEGLQWFAGAKINQIGGLGDRIAQGIFKGAAKGVGTRIALDTVDSGLEGFVRPGLNMIYKDYGEGSFVDKYKTAFSEAGGWQNVGMSAAMGAIGSAVGEYTGARRLLKEAKKAEAEFVFKDGVVEQPVLPPGEDTLLLPGGEKKLLPNGETLLLPEHVSSSNLLEGPDVELSADQLFSRNLLDSGDASISPQAFGDSVSAKAFLDSAGAEGVFDTDFTKAYDFNIDGGYIKSGNHEFNTRYVNIPEDYKWFLDGSFLPPDTNVRGCLKAYEPLMDPSDMMNLINKNRASMSGVEYTRLGKATNIFASEGYRVNTNELKLILNHSEGNVLRIKNVLEMTYSNADDASLDALSKRIASELFAPSTDPVRRVYKAVLDDCIQSMKDSGDNYWKTNTQIIEGVSTDRLLNKLKSISPSMKEADLKKAFKIFESTSPTTLKQIAGSEGNVTLIKKILSSDSAIPASQIDNLTSDIASTIFPYEQLVRYKANLAIDKSNFEEAYRLLANSGNIFDDSTKIFKSTINYNEANTRKFFYSVVHKLTDELGMSFEDSIIQAKLMYASAMGDLGVTKRGFSIPTKGLFTDDDYFLHFNRNLFSIYDDQPISSVRYSDYMLKKYGTSTGIDESKLIKDFTDFMDKQQFDMQARKITDKSFTSLDYKRNTEANKVFKDSFLYTVTNKNNPNREEALCVIGKMLELESQGKKIKILNDGGLSGSHFFDVNNTINLDISTVDGKHIGTVFHENGHAIFKNTLNAEYPTNFEGMRTRAIQNLEQPHVQRVLKLFKENEREINEVCNCFADERLVKNLKGYGYSSLEDYYDHLVRKYERLSVADRKQALGDNIVTKGSTNYSGYDKYLKGKLDFKDPKICARIELDQMRKKAADSIYRKNFADYEIVSGIIDSTTQGEVYLRYGHGQEYFKSQHDPNYFVYHELIADYSNLRLSGNNHTIRFLKFILGDEIMNQLDHTYQHMLS